MTRTHEPPSWVPNAISGLRIALVPLYCLVGASNAGIDTLSSRIPALLILLAIGVSDLVDGYVARRYGLTSKSGVILDATADRFAQLVITGYFVFFDPILPLWFLGMLVVRDILIGLGVGVVLHRGDTASLRHAPHGKMASSVVFALFVALTLGVPPPPLTWLVGAATLSVLFSTAGYAVLNWPTRDLAQE